jgi:hypothetical protein
MQPDDSEVKPIVGAKNLTIALGAGCDGHSGDACCEGVEEFTSCNQCFFSIKRKVCSSRTIAIEIAAVSLVR